MGRISLPKSLSKPKSSLPSIGDAFKSLGNKIAESSNKTNNEIKQTFTSDKAMAGYKTATNIAIGVASLTPVGKALAQGAIAISDKATGGKATAYLGPTNSTLNMVPGGALFQAITKEVDPKLQNTLNQYDPKKALIKDATSIGKTAVTHPSQVGNTVKSVAASNIHSVQHTPAVSTLTKSAAKIAPTPQIHHPTSKPSLHTALTPHAPTTIQSKASSFAANTKKPMSMPQPPARHTLKITPPAHEDTPTISAPQVKPTLIQAAEPVPSVDTPTPVTSTLSKNTALHDVVSPPAPVSASSSSSSSSSMLPIAGGLAVVAAIFLLMKR